MSDCSDGNIIKQFLNPIAASTPIVALALGAIADPEGWINSVICGAIDMIAVLFPSTPDNLKIAYLLNSVAAELPMVGRAIVFDTFQTIASISAMTIIVKIYKLIPFKAT